MGKEITLNVLNQISPEALLYELVYARGLREMSM